MGYAFTTDRNEAAFRRSGIHPLNPDVLLSVPRPASAKELGLVMTPAVLEGLREHKRCALRKQIKGEVYEVAASGFIDTTKGAVLTCDAAMMLARSRDARDTAGRENNEAKASERALVLAKKREAWRVKKERDENQQLQRRAELAGKTVEEFREGVRPLAVRRAIARSRATLRRRPHPI